MPRGGCARGTADVYHKSHCPPLTEFVEPPSLPPPPYPARAKGERERESERTRERERKRERATRATRCKTLPVNFIALGTSSYTSTCATRHLTYLHSAGNRRDHHPSPPSTPPRLLIRSGVNLTAGTFRRRRTHVAENAQRHARRLVRRSYCLCTHRTRGCTCIYRRRRVGGSAVTNVTVKLLFNYRREDFAYYAIFRFASETEAAAAAVVGGGARNSPKIFYFARAADPRPSLVPGVRYF